MDNYNLICTDLCCSFIGVKVVQIEGSTNNMKDITQVLGEVIFMLALGLGIFLGVKVNYIYFLIPVIVIALGWFYLKFIRKSTASRRMEQIKASWGKKLISKRDYDCASELFMLSDEKEKVFCIDDITWRDLNMNVIVEKIDHTASLPGLQYLYRMLRMPCFKKDEIDERIRSIKKLQQDAAAAVEIQQKLDELGSKRINGLLEFLTGKVKYKIRTTYDLKILSYLIFLAPALFVISPKLGFLLLCFLLLGNFGLYNYLKREIASELSILKYLGRLIACARDITKSNAVKDILNTQELVNALDDLRTLETRLSKINLSSVFNDTVTIKSEMEIVLEYYNMLRMREPIVFYEAVRLLNQNSEKLLKLHMELGKLDAYVSIASYRESIEYYALPEFLEDSSDRYLHCEEAYHSLLVQPVANSLKLSSHGALITGSNASGKSTFLRTIGVNALFAQTIVTVLAREYKSSFFKVLTSIGNVDSITDGDSYFMTEAKSIKRIISELENEVNVLCILDEIFRGTNTVERISGATSVLKYLTSYKCCVLAATHDLELTQTVQEEYHNYHFREEVKENDIYFDYKLHKGASTSRNAIMILKQLGYPEQICSEAMKMASDYHPSAGR